MGAAVGSGWQVSVGSQGACPIESRCRRMDGEAESVLIKWRWIWEGNMADPGGDSSFYKVI